MSVVSAEPQTPLYPSAEEALTAVPVLGWIDSRFLRPDPFAFHQVGVDFRSFVARVAEEFSVEPNGVFCVGSGAIGSSLNPGKMLGRTLRQFDDSSDLDVALISEVHFESAWRDLRSAAQPTLTTPDQLISDNLSWQKKRFFDGAIIANKLLPALSFGPLWLGAAARLSQWVAIEFDREVEVNYWIFRDYWSVRNYVADSIIKCRKKALA